MTPTPEEAAQAEAQHRPTPAPALAPPPPAATTQAEPATDELTIERTDTLEADTVPTSFGVFKPVGHLMVGMPGRPQVAALVRLLHGAGWQPETLQRFDDGDSVAELDAMVQGAGVLAGLGYEIVLLRRYLAMARDGARWLLVKVEDEAQAREVADMARDNGATLAVHYRTLTVESLL